MKRQSANLSDHDFELLPRSIDTTKSGCTLDTLEIVVLDHGTSCFVQGPRPGLEPSAICKQSPSLARARNVYDALQGVLRDNGLTYTTRYGPVYLQTPYHWGTASGGVVRENAAVSHPPTADPTLRPFYSKFGCPHYDELIEFAKRLGRDDWAWKELVMQGLMAGVEFRFGVKVHSI